MDDIDIVERLRTLEEKELKRREAVKKCKQRPEYKEKIKGYNKKYYQNQKSKTKTKENCS